MIKLTARQFELLQKSLCKHLMLKMLGDTSWINPVAASVITDNYLEISSCVIKHLSKQYILYRPDIRIGSISWPSNMELSHNSIDKAELKSTIVEWLETNRELLALLPISGIK